jgi:hypothetical protein
VLQPQAPPQTLSSRAVHAQHSPGAATSWHRA